MSILIVVGPWDRPGINLGWRRVRVCLGFVAVVLLGYDLEVAMEKLSL